VIVDNEAMKFCSRFYGRFLKQDPKELNLQSSGSDLNNSQSQLEELPLECSAQIAVNDERHTHKHVSFADMEVNLKIIAPDYFALAHSMRMNSTQSKIDQEQLEYSSQIVSKDEDHTSTQSIKNNSDPIVNAKISLSPMRLSTLKTRALTLNLNNSVLNKPLGSFHNFLKYHRNNDWLISFYHLDPRYQIQKFFNDVAREGADKIEDAGSTISEEGTLSPILRFFPYDKASAFSVWRATGNDAIRMMMTGEGTGKGLDVKGKSAKKGKLAGFVPFLQIHEEEHKKKVRWPPEDGSIRIYYKSEATRNLAALGLITISKEMETTVAEAKLIISKGCSDKMQYQTAFENLKYHVADPMIYRLNDYSPLRYGIRVAERVFFNAYISRQDITRCSDYHTGRHSEPNFQDMNFICTRKYKGSGPRAVVLQLSETVDDNIFSPKSLVIAYEEYDRVTPVVSDFDCFLVGTRGVNYKTPLSQKQVEMMSWLLTQIELILESPCPSTSWTSRWLQVLKENAVAKGFFSEMPKFGLGDPKSYAIMENVVSRLKSNGAVRHGAECFNYCFPQELDDRFLVIFADMDGKECKVPWKYMNVKELQDMLCSKIEKGYIFPLNPKWILADHGWKAVYDKMLLSKDESIQKSLAVWYPQYIRELINSIHTRFPDGFDVLDKENGNEDEKTNSTERMNLVKQQSKRYHVLQRAKSKIRISTTLME